MRIYKMTATFGKLEHATLELKPGLNIITAPNEWGKSTWCAFLVAMLYGLDTRAKSTKNALADKERYAPWSGSPMAGRIDLHWNGRDITIERSTKGRTPMGVFRAYETASGLEVPELTAANCGQALLGVERSVFARSAFLRLTDLPVTQDDALRHRLNALVTTGDESGAAEALGQKLRDLKNRCRYNKSGLLPQAESQREELERKLAELDGLNARTRRLESRSRELEEQIAELENHKTAMQYAAAQDDAQRVKIAEAASEKARTRYRELEGTCEKLPSREEAEQALRQLDELQRNAASLQAQERLLPPMPPIPPTPACFADIPPENAVERAERDRAALAALTEPKKPPKGGLLALIAAVAVSAIALIFLAGWIYGAVLTAVALGLAGWLVSTSNQYNYALKQVSEKRNAVCMRYGTGDPAQWVALAHRYAADWRNYNQALEQLRIQRQALDDRRSAIEGQSQEYSGRNCTQWQQILQHWDALEDARREAKQAQNHFRTLQAVVKTAPAPEKLDMLEYTVPETDRLLAQEAEELKQLQGQLGQCKGRMEMLGSADALNGELETVQRRIQALEQTYSALEKAQEALGAARQELQRRFAPRITQRAAELFGRLTGDRYDRFLLGEDLSVQAGARGEDVLRSQQWRSDGTVDQLYLALRLAVAGELIPDAPLVLDDALVRFDDKRLAVAMEILKQEAVQKQVILFTCQTREKTAAGEMR